MPQYTLRGVEVQFPYDAYPCQIDYMEKVIDALQNRENALLESPTGTGKTLCLLCATLAWRESLKHEAKENVDKIKQENHKSETVQGLKEAFAELKAERAEIGVGLPTIVYSSRTHSQIKQVMRELKATKYKIKTSVLASRQQTCLHQHVQQLSGPAANHACRALVTKRGCKWYNNTERFLNTNPDLLDNNLDIEDLVKVGEGRTVCPYYLSRSMTSDAELIFTPYNYLVDKKTRSGLGISWENAVLIFDEAHNIESVCSSAGSFDLPLSVIASSIEEVGTAAELVESETASSRINAAVKDSGEPALETATRLRELQLILKKFEEVLSSLKVPKNGITRPGHFILEIFSKINLDANTFGHLNSAIEVAIEVLTQDALESGRRSGARSSSTRLYALQEALSIVFRSDTEMAGRKRNYDGYRVHIHLERHLSSGMMLPTLSFWCFDPGEGMLSLFDMKIRSILLTSGTLSPLGGFAEELCTPFNVRLENPHVIDKSQIWVGVVPKGPQGHTLNSSFKTRNESSYKQDLGNAIVNFARIVPDGLLVFFPSYGVLKSCIEAWKDIGQGGASVWERICQYKSPVVEPKDSATFASVAEDFKSKLDSSSAHGAVFFGVCRGKASEGLDFSDRAGRGVIITGIPFATLTDAKVKIKKEVMDSKLFKSKKRPASGSDANQDELISGDSWYVQQAIRAVNQAIGRVIRHKEDYGAILLCDERFSGQRLSSQLSKWLRDDIITYPSYGAASSSLTKFFKEKSANRPSSVNPKPAATAKEREAFSLARPIQPSASHLAQAVPRASNVIGISDLLGPLAKESNKIDQLARQQKGTDRPSLLNLLGSSDAGGKMASETVKKTKGNLNQEPGAIDRLLQEKDVPAARRGPSWDNITGKALMNSSSGERKPWEKQFPTSSGKTKTIEFGKRIIAGKESKLDRAQQSTGGRVAVGPKHLVEKHIRTQKNPDKPVTHDAVQPTRVSNETSNQTNDSSSATSLLTEMRQTLSLEGFKQISNALRQYAKTRDTHQLLTTASRELHHPKHARLCRLFKNHVPEEHRDDFDSMVRNARNKMLSSSPAEAPPPIPPPMSLVSQAIDRAQAAKQADAKDRNRTARTKEATKTASPQHGLPVCPCCRTGTMSSPYTSSCCSQIACYSCWLRAVALKSCMHCKKPIRKNMLSKVYFSSKHKN